MKKSILLFWLLLALADLSLGQENLTIKGLVFEAGTAKRIEQVQVINQRTLKNGITDEWGSFEISAAIGDTLKFSKVNFEEVSQPILIKKNLIVYLTKAIALKEVVIKEQSKALQQQEILDGFRSKGVYFNGKPPILAYIFSPLTALNEILGTDANNARKFGTYINRENAESMVDRHFNRAVIKKSIDIPDADIVEFMYLYRPAAEDVLYRNDYDDMHYVRKSYDEFLKSKSLAK